MITKEQIKEKTQKLINQAHESMTKNLDRILEENNGVINNEDFDNNYILPRLIINALLKEEMFQYKMLDTRNKKEMKIIERIYALL